jgi:isopentenyl-diphosphate delta-isomerase
MDDMMIPAWDGGALRPLDKLEVHRRGLRHPAVSVFLRVGETFLWQQRALGKYHSGGLWANACCSHAHWGETQLDCAHRRMAEELGIDGLTFRPLGQVEYRAIVGPDMTEHELVDVFLAELSTRPGMAPDSAEVAAVAWMSLAEIDAAIGAKPDDFTPWLKLYLTDHRAELFGDDAFGAEHFGGNAADAKSLHSQGQGPG